MLSLLNHATLIIPAAGAISPAYQLRGQSIIRIWAPPVWTAAALTFQGSRNGQQWDNIYDVLGSEAQVVISGGADGFDRSFSVPHLWTLGLEFVRFRSGSATLPVSQAAERVIDFTFRPFA